MRVMKRYSWAFLCWFIFFGSSCDTKMTTFGDWFKNEPDGFRGIKWGDSIASIKGMSRYGESEYLIDYRQKDDILDIDGVPVNSITYQCYKPNYYKLARVFIEISGFDNWSKIKNVMYSKFGKSNNFWWRGTKTTISTFYYEKNSRFYGSIIFESTQLSELSDAGREAEREAIEKKRARGGF